MRRWILGISAAACSALLFPALGEAQCGGVERRSAGRDAALGPPPLAIGDSVLLGALEEVAAVGYDVDVRGCRQWSEGMRVLRSRRLPRLVVVALGTNWHVTPADVRTALRIVGPRRVLGLVTPTEPGGGGGSDAAVLRAAARRHPRRTVLLDWVAFSAGRGYTYSDGMHLTQAGQFGMARLFRRALAVLPVLRARPVPVELAPPPVPPTSRWRSVPRP